MPHGLAAASRLGAHPPVTRQQEGTTWRGRGYAARALGELVAKSDDYEHQAVECLRLAQATDVPNSKALLLEMAQAWMKLALQAKAKQAADPKS